MLQPGVALIKLIRFTQVVEIAFVAVLIWMAIESFGRQEWISGVLFVLMSITFLHSIWKDLQTERKTRGTA
jgi:hypothetical protein